MEQRGKNRLGARAGVNPHNATLSRSSAEKGTDRLAASQIASWQHHFWSIVTGADIPLQTQIGGGLLLPHPNGIVVHPDVTIGPNCLIFQQVTVKATERGIPIIGGHVDIGAGAKIIGPVVVGAHSVIGANAVVTRDVPAGSVVAGVPARVIGRTQGFSLFDTSATT